MPKFRDLTGEKFGRWTVLFKTNNGWDLEKALETPVRKKCA